MNNYITLYGEPLEYPHQVSVDKRGVAYYGFNMATERVSGIKDITQVIVEEGTPAFKSLTAIDQVKDLLDCKLLVTGRIRTRNIKRNNTDSRTKEKGQDKKNQAAEKEHSKLYISVRAQEITDQEYEGDTNGVVLTGFVCKKGDMRTTPRGIRIAPVIAATPDLADVQLPMGCEYLVLDKNYQVTETTLEGDDLDRAMEYAISGKINSNLNKQYLFVTRKNEYVVLQYYIGSQFTNEWLYEHFPSPEILLYIFIAINCIAVCVILTAKFAKNMRTQLSPLFEATRQVAEQNLDFEVGHSKIKEFEDVLCSFANMKDNLKISLEKQWNAEQLQREQIAALAHDLKTPLTVIQGNIDLINETELDDEQRLYAGYITESSEQIGIYIKALIDISRTIAGYQLHLEKFDIADYMGQIEAQASSLCLTKGICLQLETGVDLGTLKADKLLLERAIMNVISNALDYSPP